MRNTVEAIIVAALVYGFTKILELFLPYLVVISIRLILWFLLVGITLKGVYGEPLSVYLLNMINYSNSRTYVTLKPPQRSLTEEEKEGGKVKKEKKTLADRIFTKGAKKDGKKKK